MEKTLSVGLLPQVVGDMSGKSRFIHFVRTRLIPRDGSTEGNKPNPDGQLDLPLPIEVCY